MEFEALIPTDERPFVKQRFSNDEILNCGLACVSEADFSYRRLFNHRLFPFVARLISQIAPIITR